MAHFNMFFGLCLVTLQFVVLLAEEGQKGNQDGDSSPNLQSVVLRTVTCLTQM